LLLVSKPFAAGYKEDFDGHLIIINMLKQAFDMVDGKLLTIRIAEQIRKNPSKAKELYKLYAGDLSIDENIPKGKLTLRLTVFTQCFRRHRH
jgi:hypothetical protein